MSGIYDMVDVVQICVMEAMTYHESIRNFKGVVVQKGSQNHILSNPCGLRR